MFKSSQCINPFAAKLRSQHVGVCADYFQYWRKFVFLVDLLYILANLMLLHDSLTKIFQTQESHPALLMIPGLNNNARILKFKKIERQMQSAQTDSINFQKKRYSNENAD